MFFFSTKIFGKINRPACFGMPLCIQKKDLPLPSREAGLFVRFPTGFGGRVARLRSAKPATAVRIRFDFEQDLRKPCERCLWRGF